MKAIKITILITLLSSIAFLQNACSEDGYSLGDWKEAIVTVNNSGSEYSFTLDTGEKLWVAATNVGNNKPAERRAIINYTIIGEAIGIYDHSIRLNGFKDVLTKDIQWEWQCEICPDDPLELISVEVGGDFLTFRIGYNYGGGEKNHEFDLYYTMQEVSDEYLELELRHNKNNDAEKWKAEDYICFDLSSLKYEKEKQDSVKLRINVNTYEGRKTYDRVYKYNKISPRS